MACVHRRLACQPTLALMLIINIATLLMKAVPVERGTTLKTESLCIFLSFRLKQAAKSSICCAVLVLCWCCAVLCCAEGLSARTTYLSVSTLLQRQSRSWPSFPWRLWLQKLASAYGCQSMPLVTMLSLTSAQAWTCPHRYMVVTVRTSVSIHIRSM